MNFDKEALSEFIDKLSLGYQGGNVKYYYYYFTEI